MTIRIPRLPMLVAAFSAACIVTAGAQAPDNTARNARDRQPTAKTADQQSNAATDLDTTRRIRRAIVADKTLSTNAHNVKIITRGGKVTLKGPVGSDAEKKTVEALATEIAGADHVTSQVSVTDPTAKTSTKASSRTTSRKPAATPKER
jgi:hyperosmotically inducible periplasmic protein